LIEFTAFSLIRANLVVVGSFKMSEMHFRAGANQFATLYMTLPMPWPTSLLQHRATPHRIQYFKPSMEQRLFICSVPRKEIWR